MGMLNGGATPLYPTLKTASRATDVTPSPAPCPQQHRSYQAPAKEMTMPTVEEMILGAVVRGQDND